MPSVTDGMPWLIPAVLGAVTLATLGAGMIAVRRRRGRAAFLITPRPVNPTSLPDDPELTATLDRRAVRRAAGRAESEGG